jgi:hypothetical protein
VLRCRGGAEVTGNTNSHLGSPFYVFSQANEKTEGGA